MRADDDLESYAAARRPQLEDLLLRLGCPTFSVPGLVTEGLEHCRRGWARAVREDDVDVVVVEAVLAAWHRRSPEGDWLERLDPALREVTGLDDAQVAVVRDGLVRVRRRTPAVRVVAALVAVLALLVVVGVWWPEGDEPAGESDPLPPAPAQEVDGLVDVAWYAAGQLRLRDTAIAVGAVRELVAVPDGVVYLAGDGAVVRVDRSGTRQELGAADPTSDVVASADGRQVAWREAGGDVVVSADGAEAGRLVGSGATPVALDDGWLFLNDGGGSLAWTPGDPEGPMRLSPVPLLDVRDGTRLYQVDPDTVRLTASIGTQSFDGPGRGGSLSSDGRFALVGSGSGTRVYDVLGGTTVTGLARDERIVSGALGSEATLVAVVAVPERARDDEEFGRLSAAGSWELRTCRLGAGECEVASLLSAAGDVPLFAR